ncbi:Folylpolyglutamate synthase mitochondrial [Fasciola gigantica]|uniref:Folylpolyglutamate synthase mitochondrial n=1 Tax=Fasciola gigantica TaxID=46835 RepID=A0A504YPF0_FASGI|nr:Folylpolyglutamate synthase mitochondrial [Fasciola gigantica]
MVTMEPCHRNYEEALEALNECILANGHCVREARPARSLEYLSALGISETQLKKLNVIHVAGSKGKGSTCAVTENVLRHLGFKTGFLSSPHLINVEERIRINGKPIDRQLFAHLFWFVYDRITQYTEMSGTPRPGYLHYIILMACKAFLDQKVDVAVVEVGLGGRFDHTNFFSTPAVSVVTHLCLEHTNVLGNTLTEIAWRKSGIFRPHCYAVVSRDQTEEVIQVLKQEANLVECPLFVAPKAEEILVLHSDDGDDDSSHSKDNLASFSKAYLTDRIPFRLSNLELSLTAVHLWIQHRNGMLSDSIGKPPFTRSAFSMYVARISYLPCC